MTLNCTVAFMAQCNSWNKCRASCQSMGATSYRWFHDGCCECVGSTCLNYGINESRCKLCSAGNKEDEDLKDPQYDDYGQDEDELGEDGMDQLSRSCSISYPSTPLLFQICNEGESVYVKDISTITIAKLILSKTSLFYHRVKVRTLILL